MPPRFYKHKLLFDEGVYARQLFQRVNGRYNVKHVKHDLHKEGMSDIEVYKIAVKQKRIIVTFNTKDFRKFANQNTNSGVIGITEKLTPEKLDIKLNSILSKSSEKSFYGKYTPLSGSKK